MNSLDKFTKAYMHIISEMNRNNIIKESSNDEWSEAADKISKALQSEDPDIVDKFLQEMGWDEDLYSMKEEFIQNNEAWDEEDIDEPEILWDIVINKLSENDIVNLAKKYQLI